MVVIITILGVLMLIAALVIYGIFSWGLVLYKFWYWFLLPVFTTLPSINFWQAIGLCLFVSLFKNHNSQTIKKEYREDNAVYTSIIAPWIVLFIGWIIHSLIR